MPASSAPPNALFAVAGQLVAAFGHAYPAWTIEEACTELANANGLPQSLLVVQDGRTIGCASLLADDEVEGFAAISPWLGNLWVDPAHRGRGVGRALVDAVVELARAGGADSLHLVADNTVAWYARIGWAPLGAASVHGHQMTVMRRSLATASGLG